MTYHLFFDGVRLGCCCSMVVVMVFITIFPDHCAIKIYDHWINHRYYFSSHELIVFIFNFFGIWEAFWY